MRAVHVGVRHDHDLVIAQLLDVEVVASDAGAHRLDERADFLGTEHPVEAGTLDVEDLALQGKDRLDVPVAALLGRAAGRVALDQEQLAFGWVALLTVGKLAGERSDVHHALAPGELTRLFGGLARGGGVDHLLDDGAGVGGIFLEPFGELVGDQAFERLADLGGDELVLGLRAELGVGELHGDDRRQPLAHVVAGKADLLALQDAALFRIIVEGAGERGAERGEMGAAVALRDVVGEAEDLLVIAVVPFERDVDPDILALAVDGDRLRDERGLGAIEIADEGGDPAFIIELDRFLLLVAGIGEDEAHAGIEKGELAEAVLELVEIELGDLERLGAGQEGDPGPLLLAGPTTFSGASASP